MRTHSSAKLVNRESRFFRSAGLHALENIAVGSSPPRASNLATSPSKGIAAAGQLPAAPGTSAGTDCTLY